MTDASPERVSVRSHRRHQDGLQFAFDRLLRGYVKSGEAKREKEAGVHRTACLHHERNARGMPCVAARTRAPGMPVDEIPPGMTFSSRREKEDDRRIRALRRDSRPPSRRAELSGEQVI